MTAFDHLAVKYGMEADERQVDPATIPQGEEAYARLCELLNRFHAVAQPFLLGEGRYCSGGFGLTFAPNWADEVHRQEIYDLFWGPAFDLFMERHRDNLPVYRQPTDNLTDEEWANLTT